MDRQLGVAEFPLDRLDILYVLVFCFLGDVIQKPRIDINRINWNINRSPFSSLKTIASIGGYRSTLGNYPNRRTMIENYTTATGDAGEVSELKHFGEVK